MMFYIQKNKKSRELVDLFMTLDQTDDSPSGLAQAFLDWSRDKDRACRHWQAFYFKGRNRDEDPIQTLQPAWVGPCTLGFSGSLPPEIQSVNISPPADYLIVKPVFQIQKVIGAPPESSSRTVMEGRKIAELWDGVFMALPDTEPVLYRQLTEQEKSADPLIGSFRAGVFPFFFLYITGDEMSAAIRDELIDRGESALAEVFSSTWSLWRQSLPAQNSGGKTI